MPLKKRRARHSGRSSIRPAPTDVQAPKRRFEPRRIITPLPPLAEAAASEGVHALARLPVAALPTRPSWSLRLSPLRRAIDAAAESCRVFLSDTCHGMMEVSHNSLALVGLALVAAVLFAASRQDLRSHLETRMLAWLQTRQEARVQGSIEALATMTEPSAIHRATASDPKELNREQALVARWLSRRYHVAPEPVSRLVKEAWTVGAKVGLEPTLILAIMAIESSFNPFAQSPMGAQGLMQVMTRVHDDKYVAFGGRHAAFDPVTNLRVGVLVLKECIARAGSLEAGLRFYVGAGNLADDSGYAWKVQAEQKNLRAVAQGVLVPVNVPFGPPPPAAKERDDSDEDAPADAVLAPTAGNRKTKVADDVALAR